MIKVAICGDVHWSTYSSIIRKRGRKYSHWLERLIKSMNWFEKLAKEHKCSTEIFLGDTLDRPDLNAEELTALQDIKWNKIPKKFLVGNHESNINTLEFSSTKFFESIEADVISSPRIESINDNVDFCYVPFVTTDKKLDIKNYIPDNNKKKVLFAHQDLAGVQYGKFTSQSGFDVTEVCNNCEYMFDGHLHNELIINDKIILVGILSGQNFNEDASKYKHRAYILTIEDDGTMSYEAFVNPEAFNFYKLRFETEDDFKILDTLDDHAVVSAVCEEKISKKLLKIIKQHKNISESRMILFYNYSNDAENKPSILVDDYIKQFIMLAQDKIEHSSVLDNELARLGGD